MSSRMAGGGRLAPRRRQEAPVPRAEQVPEHAEAREAWSNGAGYLLVGRLEVCGLDGGAKAPALAL